MHYFTCRAQITLNFKKCNQYSFVKRNFVKSLEKYQTHPRLFAVNMKIFRSVKTYLSRMGLKPQQLTQSHPFNAQSLIVLSVFGLSITFCSAYFFLDAKSFVEHTESLYLVCVTIVLWKMPKVFELINNFQCVINESK